jgi:hypothetical protein
MLDKLSLKELISLLTTLEYYNKFIVCIFYNKEGEIEIAGNEIPRWEKYIVIDRKTIKKQIQKLKNGK